MNFLVFNTTFSTKALICGYELLLVEEAKVPRENNQPLGRKTDNPSQSKFESSTPWLVIQ